MAFDWIAGLFQSEQTRGLSGDSASAVALDDSNPYYNYRLRRHKAEGDLVADPGLLWYTSPLVKQRTGLGTHIAAEQGEGVANFTDVLMILSEGDHAAASAQGWDPWLQKATRALSQEFENFCRREQFSRLYSHRQLGFRILCDGSEEMGRQSLGLGEGEFVTGLLPNLYTGPVRGSYPVIGVHLNLPGVFDGYREVGRLHNDQILFTLGSHWLDNFCHPTLREAALYRLQQYPDGSFVHIVNPDLQDRYQVTSVQQNGTNVLTLATRDGTPLAYMVLAVIDPPADTPSTPGETAEAPSRRKPGIAMPVAPSRPEPDGQPMGFKNDPEPARPPRRADQQSIPPPMLIDDALQPVQADRGRLGSKTIIPDAPSERIFTLQERGALLQKVHFSAFMEGYDVYMGRRGELGTVVEDPAATFQVRKRQVSLLAHIDLMVGGRKVTAGSEVMIEGDTNIQIGNEQLAYRDLRGLRVDGWPYVGEIRRPASSNYMIWGDRYKIGRSRECRVVLPDEPRNDNIHWKASVGAGATIRARTGEIPKSRFYTDSIMVASEHATVDVKNERPEIVCNARHCYVYVRRHNEVMPLYPATSGRTPQQMDLEPGDEILIGNCLFQVGFNPNDASAPMAPPAAPAPEVKLSPDSLVNAVSEPDFDSLDAKSTPDVEERMGIEMLEPIDPPSEPMDVVSMESVTGASIRAEADRGLADFRKNSLEDSLSMPPIEDVGDEPTSPGMVVPRELLEEDGHDDDLDEGLEDSAPTAPANEPNVDPSRDAVAGWDEDDWEEATGPREVPDDAPEEHTPIDVPAPFPEVQESDIPLDAEETADEPLPEDEPPSADEAPPSDEPEPFQVEEPPSLQDEEPEPFQVEEPPPLPVEEPPPLPVEEPPPPPVDEAPPLPVEEPPPLPVEEPPPLPASDVAAEPPPPPSDAPPPLPVDAAPAAVEDPPSLPDEPVAPDAAEVDAPTPPPLPADDDVIEDAATVVTRREPPPEEDDPYAIDQDDAPTEMALPVLNRSAANLSAEPAAPADVPEDADATEQTEAEPPSRASDISEEATLSARTSSQVVYTDDSEAQFELGRPLHLVLSGWTVRGEVVAGNHRGADLVIPENRIVEGQTFPPTEYFRLKVRGRKGQLEVLQPSELLINEDDPREEQYTDLSALTIDVIRRDDQGEEDFVVRLVITTDTSLPDPRARFVALDYEDPLAAALVTRGLGVNQPRRMRLGDIEMNLTWDGEKVTITDYFGDYKGEDGFKPFFVQQDEKRFVTAPEDGADIELAPGDRMVVGTSVYLIRGI